jgi:hypothetical protein
VLCVLHDMGVFFPAMDTAVPASSVMLACAASHAPSHSSALTRSPPLLPHHTHTEAVRQGVCALPHPLLPHPPFRSQKLSDEEYVHDAKLVQNLLALMAESGADFTNTFRNLAAFPTPAGGWVAALEGCSGPA